jgi:predicted phosphodiesterase
LGEFRCAPCHGDGDALGPVGIPATEEERHMATAPRDPRHFTPLRIAVFSDAHGNLTALRAVLDALAAHRPLHMVVAAGDHVLVGPRPAATWDALQDAGVCCIVGNDDELLWGDWDAMPASRWAPLVRARLPPTVADLGPARIAALKALPTSLRIAPAPGEDLLILHANLHGTTGWAFNATMAEEDIARLYGGADARVICCGHYHGAAVRRWGETTLVNVASVSIPHDNQPLAGYTILDWDGAWRVAQYRVPYDTAAEERAFATSAIPTRVPLE